MKKHIKNRVYDTNKATELATWHDSPFNYPTYYSEKLYQKKTGEYFLYGRGGPESPYCAYQGNGVWTAGERIIPMTPADASDWARSHLKADQYDDIFVTPQALKSGKEYLTCYLDSRLVEAIRHDAKTQGLTVASLMTALLRDCYQYPIDNLL